MRSYPEREGLFQEAMNRIGHLSPSEGADVLLHYFMSVLSGTDSVTAERMRQELLSRFGGRYCSQRTLALMADLLNGHLSQGFSRRAAASAHPA